MKLKDISINNLRRRKGKVFFLVLGLVAILLLLVLKRLRAAIREVSP